ncbi:pyrroloquinoline quinone-dependent dehydrogenase [Phenylobacterium hankyongense]|uniref:Pyrroloquinoline quinone-dependent dehydrogenase n=2 Tax=Phenylobacterium hankyongense TaxID=1813876 RepID=A0A328B4H1_9CAUL|nr:pyrroloquinoline quinone-dependent dehydrogenase [Phenylobacterium hankyongense]
MAAALAAWLSLALPVAQDKRRPGRNWLVGAAPRGAVRLVLITCAVVAVAALGQYGLSRFVPVAAAKHDGAAALDDGQVWSTFNGDLMAQKASSASQVTPQNVRRLALAWELRTGDVTNGRGSRPPTDWSATPLFVNHTVYVGTPFHRIFAVAPDTGKVRWVYDPHSRLQPVTQSELKGRGVAYWQAQAPQPGQPCQKMVYVGTLEGLLHGVDADTGRRCAGFGRGGVLDVNQWNTTNPKWPLSQLQPPTVYKDTLFIGWSGKDWAEEVAPPGTVFAIDARTGALKWTFHALTPQAAASSGTANVWASMSVDPKAGVVYVPVSSPSPDFYGGRRKGRLPFANSVTALDAATGRVVWSRQLVHHDLWDYDVNSAPVLIDLRRNGEVVPALVQSTKQGMFFVLNRLTGEPIFPIEERPVPESDVPGEEAAPTQPFTATPEPVTPHRWPGVSAFGDIFSLGQCSRDAARLRYDGRFTPPSLGAGALIYPGTAGGVQWGGGAVDPASQTYVVNSSSIAMIVQLLSRADYDATTGTSKASGYYPMEGSPYGVRQTYFLNWLRAPCWKPPYGTLSAYDLGSGGLLWRVPFGAVQKWGFFMPKSWGSVTMGAPLVTRTGIVFIGASMDSRVRAMDLRTGAELWSARVDAPAVANPATYTYKGRQYVLFTAGGNSIMSRRVGDQLAAFALPSGR